MLKFWIILFISTLALRPGYAQEIIMLTQGHPVSIRGLCVVSDQVLWVSGSAGSVGRSTDGGKNWEWHTVTGYAKSDFRDIEAFSDKEALILGVTDPALVMHTTDGGTTWQIVYQDSLKSTFLDAMDFSGNQGIIIGDPTEGQIVFLQSDDRGITWKKNKAAFSLSEPGETFFAASGSNIRFVTKDQFAFVSGGKKSSLYREKFRYRLSLDSGKETTGANAIAINPMDSNEAFIIGGDFSHDTVRSGNALRIRWQPFLQTIPLTPPYGYRSSVEYIDKVHMICCGTEGVDVSSDGGMHWRRISNIGFHVCGKSKTGNALILAGPHGAIARLVWNIR